jgi:hypothetical protein
MAYFLRKLEAAAAASAIFVFVGLIILGKL